MAAEEQDASLDQVEEEFTVWKKNTPFLYDLIVSHPLEWPSLTVHWVPSPPQPYSADPTFAVHKFVLGTHTSEDFPNFLMIADAVLPTKDSESNVGGKNENPVIPKVCFVLGIRRSMKLLSEVVTFSFCFEEMLCGYMEMLPYKSSTKSITL